MKKILLILLAVLVIGVLFQSVVIYKKLSISKELISTASPFRIESTNKSVSMLVLGDSTAVGVGATKSEDSVAGRLAAHIGATYVENFAESGAQIADLIGQIHAASLPAYTVILIHIGANDIIRFRSATSSGEQLSRALKLLPKSEKLIVIMAGNIGGTTFFPSFLNPWYTKSTLAHHTIFESVVSQEGGSYINLYVKPADDPFSKEPLIYLSPDGLHPSSEGYRLWFEEIQKKAL